MTIANCPRCCEQVSVPGHASRDATVQCPLCQEEYLLGEALAQLPPALIVLSDMDDAPASEVVNEDEDSWSELNLVTDEAEEIDLAPTSIPTSGAAFDFTSKAAAPGSKATSTIRPSSRARKPKGSPVKSVLSIVIGGLMAFPIAQLILWYLPGDLKRDFGAGPIVAQYVPAIVPAKFRGNKAQVESNSEPSFQSSDVAGSDFNFGDTDKFAAPTNSGGGNSTATSTNKNKKPKKSSADLPIFDAASADESPDGEAMSLEDAVAAGADVFGNSLEVPGLELGGLPTLDDPTPPVETTNEPIEPDDDPAATLPPLVESAMIAETPATDVAGLAVGDIRDAPTITPDMVVKNFQAALSGNLAWDTDEATTPNATLKREFYQSFSKLGEALTFADRSDEKVAAQISETAKLLHEIGKQPDKLQVIAGVANGWMGAGFDVRQTNGICLTGFVKTVEPIGEFYETTITSGNKQIAVVSTSDPTEHFAEGNQVLVLGTILDTPKKNLGGYEGARDTVVLDGFHVKIASE